MSSLSDRIAAALDGAHTSTAISALIAEAEAASVQLRADRDRAEREALDPRLSEAAVDTARAEMERAAFADRRLVNGVEALKEALKAAQQAEEAERRRAARAAAERLRDEAEKALRERYPKLAGELAALMRQLVEADQACQAAGVAETAEFRARGVDPHGRQGVNMVGTLPQTVYLPAFDAHEQAMQRPLWSRRVR